MKMLPLPTLHLSDPWTWLRAVFPARTCHSLEKVPDLPGNVVGCSGISYEPFAWWDGQNSCWRTWQRCLIEGWARYSDHWPRSGMTRSGIAYRLPTLAPGTNGTEFGYLPTPTKSADSKGSPKGRFLGSGTCYSNLREVLRDGPDDPIFPNPEFVEEMMGYPMFHTDLHRSETQSSLKSPNS